jgi:putative transposase
MANYRRLWLKGGTYFFTVVTKNRIPILVDEKVRDCLRKSIRKTRHNYPFDIIAWVLLPDHLHTLWTLPQGDSDFAVRWMLIKSRVTKALSMESIWQRRYWEHLIRDEDDLKQHFDYIHFNPVKHELVEKPQDWLWSTFHKYVELGEYQCDWEPDDNVIDLDFE